MFDEAGLREVGVPPTSLTAHQRNSTLLLLHEKPLCDVPGELHR